MTNSVLAIMEMRNGAFRKISYEVISEARRIADKAHTGVIALVIGNGIAAAAETLKAFGPDRILIADDPSLSDYNTDRYTKISENITKKLNPSVILTGASCQGKDLAARLSARLDTGLAMDCIRIRQQEGQLIYTRPIFGGKLNADVVLEGAPPIAALRPNVFPVAQKEGAAEIEKVDVEVCAGRTRVLKTTFAESDKVELSEAETVVAGGRGTGGDFSPIENLARVFNGAVAASRTVVDEGWRSHFEQVGQTGVTVSPNLYIACGISGAIQHFAGMSNSRFIIAINKDAEAPIFLKSDYGIVGDLFEIIPALIEELKKLKDS